MLIDLPDQLGRPNGGAAGRPIGGRGHNHPSPTATAMAIILPNVSSSTTTTTTTSGETGAGRPKTRIYVNHASEREPPSLAEDEGGGGGGVTNQSLMIGDEESMCQIDDDDRELRTIVMIGNVPEIMMGSNQSIKNNQGNNHLCQTNTATATSATSPITTITTKKDTPKAHSAGGGDGPPLTPECESTSYLSCSLNTQCEDVIELDSL